MPPRGTAAPVTPLQTDAGAGSALAAEAPRSRGTTACTGRLVDSGDTDRNAVDRRPPSRRPRTAVPPRRGRSGALARRARPRTTRPSLAAPRRARRHTGAAAHRMPARSRHRSARSPPQPSRICSRGDVTRPMSLGQAPPRQEQAPTPHRRVDRARGRPAAARRHRRRRRSGSGTPTRTRSARSWDGRSPRTTTPASRNGEALVTIASGDTGGADLAEPVRRGRHQDPGRVLRLPDRHGRRTRRSTRASSSCRSR